MTDKKQHTDEDGLSPFERAQIEIRREELELHRRATAAAEQTAAHLAGQQRAGATTQFQAEEKNRLAIEENEREAGRMTYRSFSLESTIALQNVIDAPDVRVTFTVNALQRGAGSKFFVLQVNYPSIDYAEADAALTVDIEPLFKPMVEEAVRNGDTKAAESIRERFLVGYQHGGLRYRRTVEVTVPLVRKIVGKAVEDLIAKGVARVIDDPAAQAAE